MFSLPKIIVLIVIIAMVWWGFKLFGRNFQQRRHQISRARRRRKPDEENAVNMEKCSVCGEFVPEEGATSCTEDDCPY